jgi:hypothetical protein
MQATTTSRLTGCIAVILFASGQDTVAKERVAAMITRIEPADTGIALVEGNGRSDEAAFMMSLYAGDVLTVKTANTVVYIKVFGEGEKVARKGEPVAIGAAAEERGMFSSLYEAVANKVFRNNQVYRRNLTTRSEGDDAPLEFSGFSENGGAQKVHSGTRSLFLRWNIDLDKGQYEFSEVGGNSMASGDASGDFLFIDDVVLVSGHRYTLTLTNADGRRTTGTLEVVSELPSLPSIDPDLGVVGDALQLLGLAEIENGLWKFEAIQGVVELSADEIDRATLIDEISLL